MSCAKSNGYSLARVSALAVPSLLTAGVLALTALVLFCFDPSRHAFYPTCVFHRTTGLLCPGCGSLRALHQLLHGHVAAAFRFNALLVSSLPLLAWFALRWLLRKARHQPVPLSPRPVWLWSALVVMVLFGVLRNLPLGALAWLRP